LAIFNFSQLKSGRLLSMAGNQLIFDGGISAADVTVSQATAGVRLAVGAKFVILKEFTIDQLTTFLVDSTTARSFWSGTIPRVRSAILKPTG
jgi:hypothetical protein